MKIDKINANQNEITRLESSISKKEKDIIQLKLELREEKVDLSALKKKQALLSSAPPLLDKIKTSAAEKTQHIKNYLNSKNIDKAWLEKNYKTYKSFCIKNGEKIKSKKEFQNFVESLKTIKNEALELNLSEVLAKLSDDAKNASEAFHSHKVQLEKKVSTLVDKKNQMFSENSQDKYLFFSQWASHKSVQLEGDNLYDNYLEFLSKSYPEKNLELISYSKKSGSFTKALKKYKST